VKSQINVELLGVRLMVAGSEENFHSINATVHFPGELSYNYDRVQLAHSRHWFRWSREHRLYAAVLAGVMSALSLLACMLCHKSRTNKDAHAAYQNDLLVGKYDDGEDPVL